MKIFKNIVFFQKDYGQYASEILRTYIDFMIINSKVRLSTPIIIMLQKVNYDWFYDYQFQGCMWVFEEEYYIIHDFLLPGFYIAVQFFFTVSFTLLLVSLLLTFGIFVYARDDDRYMTVLLSNGSSQVAGGMKLLISMLYFSYW